MSKNTKNRRNKKAETQGKMTTAVIAIIGLIVIGLAISFLLSEGREDLYPDVGYYWLDSSGNIIKNDGKKVKNPYYSYMKECLRDNTFANTDWGEDGLFHGTRAVTRQEAAVIMTNVYGMDVTARLLQDETDGSKTFTFEWLKKKMLDIAGVKKIGVEWDVEDRLDQTVTRYDMAKAMVGFERILKKR